MDRVAGPPDRLQQWDAWVRAVRLLSAELERTLGHQGASGAELQVLRPLAAAPASGMRVRDLVQELQWDRARLSHLMKRMAHRGLIQRGACAEDARGVTVELTDAGHDLAARASAAHAAWVQARILSSLDDADIAAITAIAAKLTLTDTSDTGSSCSQDAREDHAQAHADTAHHAGSSRQGRA